MAPPRVSLPIRTSHSKAPSISVSEEQVYIHRSQLSESRVCQPEAKEFSSRPTASVGPNLSANFPWRSSLSSHVRAYYDMDIAS